MFKTGQLLILEAGRHDFGYAGPFRVLKNFTKAKAAQAYEASTHKSNHTPRSFSAWLKHKGYIEEADCGFWFLGGYGFDPLDYKAIADEDGWSADAERTPKAQARHDAKLAAAPSSEELQRKHSGPIVETTGLPNSAAGLSDLWKAMTRPAANVGG